MKTKDNDIPSLYEWIGGAESIERLVVLFYQKTLDDVLLKPFFTHMSKEHIHYFALWFGEIFGGPKMYSRKYGEQTAHPHMMSKHLSLHITENQRTRWIQLMLESADEIGLPDDPEFRSAFVAYLEWGTRIAMIVSQPGTTLPDEDPMPTWGWGEQKPTLPGPTHIQKK